MSARRARKRKAKRFHVDWPLAVTLVVVVILAVGGRWLATGGGREADPVGGPFDLVAQDGRVMTDQDLLGDYALIYFGYTYCPDICPTTLQAVSDALDSLPEAVARRIRPVMISVDPERDTPEKMGAYVSLFHPRMIGLTGDRAHVEEAMRAYGILSERVDGTPNGYDMDHSALLFLMGPDGALRSYFLPDVGAAELAQRLTEEVEGG
ncbi:MAG: SCO family protein [Rhodospirillum sp.]|nr:SCO family protein [Rhodospirillum sp.]MCF8490972.1 SCO family protein [Rhodospirillum sp.]MCF8501185.1 SCO family protein [Rhodospirillum sp.]